MTIPQTSYTATMAKGIEGQLADDYPHEVVACYNDEASASIAFGRAVKYGATSADNFGVILPAAETDKIVGITVHSHEYSKGFTGAALDSTGVRAGFPLSVLRKGRILVVCEDGCTRGDRLWVRAVGSTPPEYLGGLNNADDSTDMIDCTKQGQWMETVAAGALAWLEVDFLNEPD